MLGAQLEGELGSGLATDLPPEHVVYIEGLDSVVQIAAGPSHACALRSTGELFCWGQNTDGALGDGTTEDRYLPTRVLMPTTN